MIISFWRMFGPSAKINMERSMELFGRGNVFIGTAKWNGKSMRIVVFLHK